MRTDRQPGETEAEDLMDFVLSSECQKCLQRPKSFCFLPWPCLLFRASFTHQGGDIALHFECYSLLKMKSSKKAPVSNPTSSYKSYIASGNTHPFSARFYSSAFYNSAQDTISQDAVSAVQSNEGRPATIMRPCPP